MELSPMPENNWVCLWKKNNDKNKCYSLKDTMMLFFFLLLLFNPPDRSNGNDNDVDFYWERKSLSKKDEDKTVF